MKPTCLFIVPRAVCLLNPHGSDETRVGDTVDVVEADFLTHTVQMKLFFLLFYFTPAIAFLTHTVQMKPYVEFDDGEREKSS